MTRSNLGLVLAVGWAHTKFGKLVSDDLESLIVQVALEAVHDAGLGLEAIDAIFLGNFNSSLIPLSFISSLALQAGDGLWGTPATRVENACASGSAAVHQGITTILAGAARNVLVIGAEKMTHAPSEKVGASLLGADYELAGGTSNNGFASVFANVADAYSVRYGDCSDTLALIAAKSHANALANPYAHLRKNLDFEFCNTVSPANPLVAGRLRRTDCAPVSDGAAAIVLSISASEFACHDPVRVIGMAQANDYLPANRRDPLAFLGTELAWVNALGMADIGLGDLSLIELHDCFTIAELNLYEVLGITRRGIGRAAIEEGWVQRTGRLPVNVSGGLKAKGHPVGATGVSQHVLAAQQLTGLAGDMQLDKVDIAAIQNMGGMAIANYTTVLAATA